jgi:putative membrane protein
MRGVLRRFAIGWVSNVAALYVATWLVSGVTYGDEWWTLLIAAAVFTLVNTWIKPVLTVLSIPFILLTLGLFLLVLNVFMLYLTDWLVRDFQIESFGAGLLAAIVVSVVNWALQLVLPDPYR